MKDSSIPAEIISVSNVKLYLLPVSPGAINPLFRTYKLLPFAPLKAVGKSLI